MKVEVEFSEKDITLLMAALSALRLKVTSDLKKDDNPIFKVMTENPAHVALTFMHLEELYATLKEIDKGFTDRKSKLN